jgi:hypothetical protein
MCLCSKTGSVLPSNRAISNAEILYHKYSYQIDRGPCRVISSSIYLLLVNELVLGLRSGHVYIDTVESCSETFFEVKYTYISAPDVKGHTERPVYQLLDMKLPFS